MDLAQALTIRPKADDGDDGHHPGIGERPGHLPQRTWSVLSREVTVEPQGNDDALSDGVGSGDRGGYPRAGALGFSIPAPITVAPRDVLAGPAREPAP